MIALFVAIGAIVLAHVAPFPFLLDVTDETVWRMARSNAGDLVPRLADHASPGDIIVIHDGHHEDPRADRRYAVETVDLLIPALRARGMQFGTICP